jgi:hypothetical protein
MMAVGCDDDAGIRMGINQGKCPRKAGGKVGPRSQAAILGKYDE